MLDPEAPAPIISANRTIEEGGISLLQSLLSSINSRAVPKRTLFSNLPLELSPNLKISVKGYILFKRQEPARSCYIWLNGEIPQIAEGKSAYVAEDTARTVEKVELRKAFKFGGETITFTPEELSKIRTFGDPVIRLIGFKPLTMLPIWANLRPSTFIYPSEDDVIGSTRTFSALHQSMLKKNVFGLVWYIPRKNAVPNLAALIPGAEKLDDNNEQIMPPGLWIVVLPYADDIRAKPELTKTPHLPEELIDKMHQIIQQLQLPKAEYDPSKYPNPSLQWHYRILQALALEEDVPTQPEDKTIPKVIRGVDLAQSHWLICSIVQADRQTSRLIRPRVGRAARSRTPEVASTKSRCNARRSCETTCQECFSRWSCDEESEDHRWLRGGHV
jgi:ATP-dependent DNA helicase 2 subunit 1